MLPVTTPVDAAAATAPLPPAVSPSAAAPATATTAGDSASAVAFSSLAQFLSTLALTRRQLAQLQGGAADFMLLNLATTNLTRSFKQLPPSALANLPPRPDRQGGALSARLARVLQQLGATAGSGGLISGSTLAGIGITLDPLAPASVADRLNVNPPLLRAAFTADRNGTLALLIRTTDQFHALGIAVAQAEADAGVAATPAPTTAPPAAPGSSATLAHLALNDALAGTPADALRQFAISAQEDAASALAQRIPARKSTDLAQRTAALRQELDQVQSALELQAQQQLQADLGRAGNLARPPNAADPAQAAAIAAYSGPAVAAAGMRPAIPAAQSASVPGSATIPPVRPVQPVQPIGAPGGDVNPDGTARTPR